MRIIFTLIAAMLVSSFAFAQTVRLALLHGDADIFSYEISVLRLALKNAPGEHKIQIINKSNDTNQERILLNFENGKADFDVFFTGMSPEREQRLLQIDFPITRGLLGHRVMVIHKDFSNIFQNLRTIKDIQTLITVGSGFSWPDTQILSAAGFKMIVSDYDSLWKMVKAKRFTAFNRGIQEAYLEINSAKNRESELVVDDNILITYPFDYLFYVSKSRSDLQKLIYLGLETAFNNGEFIENFNNHPSIQTALKRVDIKKRRIFKIDNPLLTDRIRKINKAYWYSFNE